MRIAGDLNGARSIPVRQAEGEICAKLLSIFVENPLKGVFSSRWSLVNSRWHLINRKFLFQKEIWGLVFECFFTDFNYGYLR